MSIHIAMLPSNEALQPTSGLLKLAALAIIDALAAELWRYTATHFSFCMQMRFLTPDWHRGNLSDEEADRIEAQYAAHRAAFAQSAPGPLRAIVSGPSLHDALVESVEVNRSQRTVVLRLLAGDQQRGYFGRKITYEDVGLERLDAHALAVIARDPESELLSDEVDALGPGLYSHALLFWPYYREILLRFKRIQVSDAARPDRARVPLRDRYSESGIAAV
jgi:hypothetical protein